MTNDVNVNEAAHFEQLAGEVNLATHERSLEVALAVVGILDGLDGQDLRGAVTRLVSELEHEARSYALLAATILGSLGLPMEDASVDELMARATR